MIQSLGYFIIIARSSNGRTRPSGGWYLGSNPSWAAKILKKIKSRCGLISTWRVEGLGGGFLEGFGWRVEGFGGFEYTKIKI